MEGYGIGSDATRSRKAERRKKKRRRRRRSWRVDHFGSVGGGGLIDATAAPLRGRRERAEGKPPFHPVSAFSRHIPPSRTVARVLTERRAFGFSAPAIPLQPLRRSSTTTTAANFQIGVASTRRDADHRCALSRSPPPSFRSFLPFVPSSRSFSPSRSLPRSLSSRLKTVRCTGDPARAYSPSLRSSLFARRSSG